MKIKRNGNLMGIKYDGREGCQTIGFVMFGASRVTKPLYFQSPGRPRCVWTFVLHGSAAPSVSPTEG